MFFWRVLLFNFSMASSVSLLILSKSEFLLLRILTYLSSLAILMAESEFYWSTIFYSFSCMISFCSSDMVSWYLVNILFLILSVSSLASTSSFYNCILLFTKSFIFELIYFSTFSISFVMFVCMFCVCFKSRAVCSNCFFVSPCKSMMFS